MYGPFFNIRTGLHLKVVVTHWGRETHISVSQLTSIGSYNGNIVNWNLRNKLQWILKRNSYIFIKENTFENVVCEMAPVFLGLNVLCVTHTWTTHRPLQWRHNGRDSVSNHKPYACLLNRLFKHRSKKTSKLSVTGLCAGNSPVT